MHNVSAIGSTGIWRCVAGLYAIGSTGKPKGVPNSPSPAVLMAGLFGLIFAVARNTVVRYGLIALALSFGVAVSFMISEI